MFPKLSMVDEVKKRSVGKLFLYIADASAPIWPKEDRHEMSLSIGTKRCESGVAECSLFRKAPQEG